MQPSPVICWFVSRVTVDLESGGVVKEEEVVRGGATKGALLLGV